MVRRIKLAVLALAVAAASIAFAGGAAKPITAHASCSYHNNVSTQFHTAVFTVPGPGDTIAVYLGVASDGCGDFQYALTIYDANGARLDSGEGFMRTWVCGVNEQQWKAPWAAGFGNYQEVGMTTPWIDGYGSCNPQVDDINDGLNQWGTHVTYDSYSYVTATEPWTGFYVAYVNF